MPGVTRQAAVEQLDLVLDVEVGARRIDLREVEALVDRDGFGGRGDAVVGGDVGALVLGVGDVAIEAVGEVVRHAEQLERGVELHIGLEEGLAVVADLVDVGVAQGVAAILIGLDRCGAAASRTGST